MAAWECGGHCSEDGASLALFGFYFSLSFVISLFITTIIVLISINKLFSSHPMGFTFFHSSPLCRGRGAE